MKIDDVFDYQKVNCCPCSLIASGHSIEQVVQTIAGYGSADGFIDYDTQPPEALYMIQYTQTKETFSPDPNTGAAGHITTRTYDDIYTAYLGNELLTPPITQTVEEGGGTSFTLPSHTTFIGGIGWATSQAHIKGILDGAKDFNHPDVEEVVGAFGSSLLFQPVYDTPFFGDTDFPAAPRVDARYLQYKLRFTPSAHPEIKYFKLNYDLVFVPDVWDHWFRTVSINKVLRQRHDEWEKCMIDSEGNQTLCGEEPPIPEPDPPQPNDRPELIHRATFEYTGGAAIVETDYVEVNPIDISQRPGAFGFYNAKYFNYRSARLGSLPTNETLQIPV